jgi:hypothetical protein
MSLDVEPTVRLRSGQTVDAAIAGLVARLTASGHTIRLVDGGAIVTPAVSESTAWLIASSHQDVKAILADRTADSATELPDLEALVRADIARIRKARSSARRRARR